MENNKPKFRLEDIAKIPNEISNLIKEIISEISQTPQLKPALVGVGNLDYSCDPYCSSNTQCNCDDHCNHCSCVDFCACQDFGGCDCYSNYDTCECHNDKMHDYS